jgi:hypothetical protein
MSRIVKPSWISATLLLICAAAPLAWGQQPPIQGTFATGSANLSQAQIDEIIRKFAAKETEFRQALNLYAFKRDALVQEIGMGGRGRRIPRVSISP